MSQTVSSVLVLDLSPTWWGACLLACVHLCAALAVLPLRSPLSLALLAVVAASLIWHSRRAMPLPPAQARPLRAFVSATGASLVLASGERVDGLRVASIEHGVLASALRLVPDSVSGEAASAAHTVHVCRTRIDASLRRSLSRLSRELTSRPDRR